jgi:hypothetical protein
MVEDDLARAAGGSDGGCGEDILYGVLWAER